MRQLQRSLFVFIWFSALCGLVYPLAVTGVAQLFFPEPANASLIKKGGVVIGSPLIGQAFSRPDYFSGRPSATDPAYDAAGSGGSNLAPSSAKLIAEAKTRIARVRKENGLSGNAPVPADLVLSSASGLDPHISPASARLQAGRVAAKRSLPTADVEALIQKYTEQPLLGIWGKERVNVLRLNLSLDDRKTLKP